MSISTITRLALSVAFWLSLVLPLQAQEPSTDIQHVLRAYAITFGWALVGTISMGIGVVITLKLFTMCTRQVDEWALIKEGNMAMAVILAALIISLGIVVASVTK